MRNSRPEQPAHFRLLATLVIFLAVHPIHPAHTDSPRSPFLADFHLAQELATTGEYDATIDADSSLLDARLHLAIPELKEFAHGPDAHDAHIDSYALKLKPVPTLSFSLGALTLSGLPARARNAVFSLTSPFHEPTEPDNDPIFGLGTAKKTDNGAIEFRTQDARIAACTTTLAKPTDSAWILAAKDFRSFSDEDEYLSLSFFSGIKRIDSQTETSWFVDEPNAPETRLLMPGAECLFRKGPMGGSVTGFGNIANARKPDSLIRSELFLDDGPLLLSGGLCQCSRNFLDFDGNEPQILSRIFFAPQFVIDETWTIGAVIMNDVRKGEKYYYENETSYAGGAGIKYEAANTRFRVQGMRKEGETTLSASVYRHGLGIRWLNGSLSSSCLIPGALPVTPEKISLAGKLGIQPFANRENGIAASLGYNGTFTPGTDKTAGNAIHKGSLEIDGFFSTRHAAWRCVLKGSMATDNSPPEGSITLETDFP